MIAWPLVAFISRVRRPIRPRAGMVNSMCVMSPRASILRHSARRLPTSSITAPTEAGGTSITRYSIGSMRLAVDLLGDDARLADRQLVALAAHVLQQDAQVQQAAAGRRGTRRACSSSGHDAQGDVRLQLLEQPVAQLPAGDVRARPGRRTANR